MDIKNQFQIVKENWLIAAVVLVVLLLPWFLSESVQVSNYAAGGYDGLAMNKAAYGQRQSAYQSEAAYFPMQDAFAPEVQDRKITKSASLSSEVDRGSFQETEQRLRSIVESTDSILLNENSNKYGSNSNSYYAGSYNIKVESSKYSAVLGQLKEIGKVTSFSENSQDITGQYVDTKTQLELEKGRLERYDQMYKEATLIADKIQLSDRILEQERTIKWLENALQNVDTQVEYSTIYVTLTEKQSSYASIALVGFGELVRALVASVNGMLSFLFMALPYILVIVGVWIIVRVVRRK